MPLALNNNGGSVYSGRMKIELPETGSVLLKTGRKSLCLADTFFNALMNISTQLLEINHLRDAHNQSNNDLNKQFTILKKCRGKFECLIYEMLFIQEMKPKLNT